MGPAGSVVCHEFQVKRVIHGWLHLGDPIEFRDDFNPLEDIDVKQLVGTEWNSECVTAAIFARRQN